MTFPTPRDRVKLVHVTSALFHSYVIPRENGPMSKHKVGIIGYGGFGQYLHRAWDDLNNAQVVAVCDLQEPAKLDEKIRYFSELSHFLQDDEVKVVSLATPPKSHTEIALSAMAAGKHVLIEKPLACSEDECRRIMKGRDENDVVASVDYMLRFSPLVEVLCELAQSNIFGKLRRIVVENHAQDEELHRDHWFWNKDLAGSILIEHAVHFIDISHAMTKEKLKDVCGYCHEREKGMEDRVYASAIYDGGLMASHYHAFARPGFFERTTQRFVFDLAEIELEGWVPLFGTIRAIVSKETKAALSSLPNLVINSDEHVNEVHDDSRPEGWGNIDGTQRDRTKLRSGGVEYRAQRLISGTFQADGKKGEVYQASLRALMKDFLHCVDNRDHKLRVTLEDGLDSLAVACRATTKGRSLCF